MITTMPELNTFDYKIIWIVGAAERLASMGLLCETPLRISPDAVDLFLEADRNVNLIFESDFEIAQMFTSLIRDQDDEVEQADVDNLVNLMLEYKNNRYKLMKYSLCHQSI